MTTIEEQLALSNCSSMVNTLTTSTSRGREHNAHKNKAIPLGIKQNCQVYLCSFMYNVHTDKLGDSFINKSTQRRHVVTTLYIH